MKATIAVVGTLTVAVVVLLVRNSRLNNEMERSIIARDITVRTLHDDLKEGANRYVTLKQQKALADQEIKDLSYKLKNSQNDLSNAIVSLNEATDKIKRLELESANKTEALGPIMEEMKQLRTDVGFKTEALKEANARLKLQEQQLSKLGEDLLATKKELTDTKSEAKNNLATIKGFQKREEEFTDVITRLMKSKSFEDRPADKNVDATGGSTKAEANLEPSDAQKVQQNTTQIEWNETETRQLEAPKQEAPQAARNASGSVNETETTEAVGGGGTTVAIVNDDEDDDDDDDEASTIATTTNTTVENHTADEEEEEEGEEEAAKGEEY